MADQQDRAVRRRAAVSRTSRGFSVDVTIDGTGFSNSEILAEVKHLFAIVDEAFPQTPKEGSK